MPKIKSLTREHFKWTNGRGHDQKPILYSMKNNQYGLGLSPHIAQTDNWWERAFDNSLKSLSVTQSTQTGEITVMQEEVNGGGVGLKDVIAGGMKGRGRVGLVLYGSGIKFVKGGWLEGGIEMKASTDTVTIDILKGKAPDQLVVAEHLADHIPNYGQFTWITGTDLEDSNTMPEGHYYYLKIADGNILTNLQSAIHLH